MYFYKFISFILESSGGSRIQGLDRRGVHIRLFPWIHGQRNREQHDCHHVHDPEVQGEQLLSFGGRIHDTVQEAIHSNHYGSWIQTGWLARLITRYFNSCSWFFCSETTLNFNIHSQGSRIYVDFSKLEFTMACSEVFRNLSLILKQNVPRVNRSKNNSSNLQSSSLGMQAGSVRNGMKMLAEHQSCTTPRMPIELPAEASWNEEQVDDWFEKLNIDQKIVENLTPCNGQGNISRNFF